MAMSDSAQGAPGDVQFGNYLLRRLLSRGGTGDVYEAFDTNTDRVVALKLLPEALSHDPQFGRRLAREVHSAARLADPHVVPIHNWGEIGGRLYIDMRFIDGTDLGAVLARDGAMRPPRAVQVVSQIASALDAAHGDGLVHRDVKPENVLLTREDFAYLTNFGIATTEEMTATRMGDPIDTYAYMAPERFAGDNSDHRSDIYSLACVLYECLSGSLPFSEKSIGDLIGAHLMQPVPRPSQIYAGVPRAFDEVIARGMAKTPDDRFASAGDLGQAARSALAT
jgi:serine/threonine protein kinase